VDAGTVVGNSVALSDSRVGEGAVLGDSVEGGEVDIVIEGEPYEGVRFGGVISDGSRAGGGAQLEPGTVVGNEARISTGVTVDGRVPSGAEVR